MIVPDEVEVNSSLHSGEDRNSKRDRPLGNQADFVANLRFLFFYARVIHKLLRVSPNFTQSLAPIV